MIGRSNRFHGHGSLRYVYQHGKTVRGPLCAIKFSVNKRRATYRVAVVVSKKVAKSAVQRNRIRRRIYEIVRSQSSQIVEPYDLVITVFHAQVATMPHGELEKVISAQLKQAGVLS